MSTSSTAFSNILSTEDTQNTENIENNVVILALDSKDLHSQTDHTIDNKQNKRFENFNRNNILEKFKTRQELIMNREIPILSKLLDETAFDSGHESIAEKYYNQMFERYGIIANAVLQNIYLENMYTDKYLLKHLLFIIADLKSERRSNLELIPLAGISNPDIEIQDLSVQCFEKWEEKKHIPTLQVLYKRTDEGWFKTYLANVIRELSEA